MIVADDLISRIRGEYLEMPGMRLTFVQACRLWQMDATTCSAVLDSLVEQGFLQQSANGTYVAFPGTPRTPVKATLSRGQSAHARRA